MKTYPLLKKHQVMKTYWGLEVQLHSFLISALDGDEWSMPRPLYPRGRPLYQFDRRLGWPQSWSGRGSEEKNLIITPVGN